MRAVLPHFVTTFACISYGVVCCSTKCCRSRIIIVFVSLNAGKELVNWRKPIAFTRINIITE